MELFNINNRILLIISISSMLLSSFLLASSAHGDDSFVVRHQKPHKMHARLIPLLKTPHKMQVRLPILKTPLKTAPRIVVPSIDKICKKTTFPSLCTSTILPSLHHRLLTPALALQVEIKACSDRTQAALAVLKTIDCVKTPVLKDLKEHFESTVEHLKVAAAAIAKHDVGTVKTRLSAVVTNFSTCKDSVAKIQGDFKLGASFKVEEAVLLHKLASNCLALSTLL